MVTNQIVVSASSHRNAYLCIREAHYRPPVATGTAQIHMAEEIKEKILVVGRELGYPSMKQELVDMARAFLEGKDYAVFAALPTRFGKSLCYACLLDILKEKECSYSILVAIIPLIVVMTDQVKNMHSMCTSLLQSPPRHQHFSAFIVDNKIPPKPLPPKFTLRPGSQYFACVALRPEVNVNTCCNARIEKISIPVLTCVQIIYMHLRLLRDTSKIL